MVDIKLILNKNKPMLNTNRANKHKQRKLTKLPKLEQKWSLTKSNPNVKYTS